MTAADCTPPTARDKDKNFEKHVNDVQFSVDDLPLTTVYNDPGIDALMTCVIYDSKARREEGTTHVLIFWLAFALGTHLLHFRLHSILKQEETTPSRPSVFKRRKARLAKEQEFGTQCYELTAAKWRHECKRTDDGQAAKKEMIRKTLSVCAKLEA